MKCSLEYSVSENRRVGAGGASHIKAVIFASVEPPLLPFHLLLIKILQR